jgi:hypothetical protein
MSWGVNLEAVARARDALLAEVAEHPSSHPLERLARAQRWLGEEDEARGRFREAAAHAENVLNRWAREDTDAISRIGSLLWRARDPDAARGWFERAAQTQQRPDDRAETEYLMGDDRRALDHAGRAAAYPRLEAVQSLAAARLAGEAAQADEAVRRFAAVIAVDRTPPDEESGSSTLSLFDWLEEAFRARSALAGTPVPDHRAMLEEAGLLRAEPAATRPEPAPDRGPQTAGTRSIDYPQPGGDGRVAPAVTVDKRGDMHFLLHPERDLRVALVQEDGAWRARLGDTAVSGRYSGPRSARKALTEPLRAQPDGQWAIALLDKLFREAYRL